MVKIFCKLCQVSVEVNSWRDHTASEKHTNNLPSNIIVKTTLAKEKLGYVHEHFAKFGNITRKEVFETDGKLIKIQYFFEDAAAYSTIVQKQHVLFGQILEIESLKLSNESATILIDKKLTDVNNLKTFISSCIIKEATFSQQIALLQDKLKINTTDKGKVLDTIQAGLSVILKPKFPDCKVYFFGSKVTGLDIGTSKLGVYVDKGKQTTVKEMNTLRTIHNLISNSAHFDSVLIFVQEEFPTIKFRHITTDTLCYLNVKNTLVVKRSELIKYYLNLDEKVRQFLVTVKFWAKCHVIFKGSSLNYALHLLAIFFLQQEPYKLPAVIDLQKDESVDLGDFGLVQFSSPALQKATILELVTGFFKYYESFDFFSYVISPFCGYPIKKTHFLEPYELPESYKLFMANKETLPLDCGLAVQDPFDHSKNILSSAPVCSGSRFASFCRFSQRLVSSGESQLLPRLLQFDLPEKLKFSLKKTFDNDWRTSVENLIQNIFIKIFCCKITKTTPKHDEVVFDFVCGCNVWLNRVKFLKEFEPDLIFCTEFEKEAAVTSRIARACQKSKISWSGSVGLVFKGNEVEVFLKTTCKERKKSVFEHFLRVKIGRFLKELELKKERSSADLAEFNSLAQTMKEAPRLLNQIILLQEKWQQNNIALEKDCKRIIDDLTAILPTKINQIYFCELDKTALNFPNKVFNIHLDSSKQTESGTLVTVKTLLEKSEIFSEVTLISGTLKLTHKKRQSRCVLTVKNQNIMARSTELIRYYLSLDKKLQPLMIVIELWMNYLKLNFLTTYTIHLMVLFYLQEKYKVPSVFDLQKTATPVMVDEWNCAIVATKTCNPKLEKSTLLDLVHGFFSFYSEFDYTSFVISPFCGTSIKKSKFMKPCDLPESFRNYADNEDEISLNLGLCVQDFFEHCRNLVPPQPLQTFSKFTSFCRCTLDLLKKDRENFLSDLFLCKVRNLTPLYEYRIEKPEGKENEEVKNLILKVMGEILSFECTETEEEGKYDCVRPYDIFINRLSVLKNIVFIGGSDFDREVAATSCIRKEYSRKIESLVQMEINFTENSNIVIVSFSSKDEDFNPDFTDFFYSRLMKFLVGKEEIVKNSENTDVISLDSDSSNTSLSDCAGEISDNEKKSKPSKEGGKVENEEDVPSDFFDDFSDDNFLNGLEIPKTPNQKKKRRKRQLSESSASTEQEPQKRWCYKSKCRLKKSRRSRSRVRTRRSKSRSPRRPKPKSPSRRSRSRTPRKSKSRSPRRSRSRTPRRSKSRTPRKSKSRSPSRRSRSRTPRRSRSRSRRRSRSKSRSRRSRSRPRSRRSRSRSRPRRSSRPRDQIRRLRRDKENEERSRNKSRERIKRKTRSRSRDSKERKPMKKNRSKSSDSSPKRRRSEEIKKRQSFLEEIRQKLNEIDSPVEPLPQLVPVPQSLISIEQKYDQNLTTVPQPAQPLPQPVPAPQTFTAIPQTVHPLPQPVPVPPPRTLTSLEQKYDQDLTAIPLPTPEKKDFAIEEKLLKEKKLSLDDYLTIRAKHQVKSVTIAQLLTKTRVISQCQDVIDIISGTKFGRVSSQPVHDYHVKLETKHKSPLLKTSSRFSFTNLCKMKPQIDPFSEALYRIFQKIGLFKEENDIWKLIDSVAEALSSGTKIDKDIAAQIFQISLLSPLAVKESKKVDVATQCKVRKSVHVQVDVSPNVNPKKQ